MLQLPSASEKHHCIYCLISLLIPVSPFSSSDPHQHTNMLVFLPLIGPSLQLLSHFLSPLYHRLFDLLKLIVTYLSPSILSLIP